MFDIRKVVDARYLEVTLYDKNDRSITINVEPPKLKMLKKIISLSSQKSEDQFDDFVDALTKILNKNKEHTDVTDCVLEMSYDEMQALTVEYFEWIEDTKNLKN